MSSTTVRVDFLARPVLADLLDRGNRLEWPPHPHRLFAALVAAHYEAGVGRRDTLEWLERQEPPRISAARIGRRTVATVYVPTNDGLKAQKGAIARSPNDKHLGDQRARQPRFFPTGVFGNEAERSVYYTWEHEGSAPEDLDSLLAEVTRLGHSSSFVAASVWSGPAPEANWQPTDSSSTVFRVPRQGSLEALDRAHALRGATAQQREKGRQRPEASVLRAYGTPRIGPPRGPWHQAMTFTLEPRIRVTAWIHLAEAIRGALLNELPPGAPEVLTGHGRGHHLAIVPLAHVGHRHARGEILGFAVLTPPLDDDEYWILVEALAGVRELWVGRLGCFAVESIRPTESRSTLSVESWQRPHRHWASVTPVVLDRYPKSHLPAEEIVARSVENLGLPRPESMELLRQGPIPGVPPSPDFHVYRRRPPRGRKPDHRPWTHVRLSFAEPVRGPILLGARRHFGLGLLRPWKAPSAPSHESVLPEAGAGV